MRRRWAVALAVLVVLDVVVLALGYRAHHGTMPPLQSTTTSFPVAASSTDAATDRPGSEAVPDIQAPVLLGTNADGVVLRATRGACEARFDNPAKVWTGRVSDDAPLTEVEVPAVTEVLGLVVYPDGSMRVAGLDESCDPVTVDSKDDGASWQEAAVAKGSGIWELSADTTATTVTKPSGEETSDLGCPPAQILNLPGGRALASCTRGAFYRLTQRAPSSLSAGDYDQLSVAPRQAAGEYLILGATQTCAASVAFVRTEDQSQGDLSCFGAARAPLAIATAPDLVIVQVGSDLMASTDGGVTFTTVGPEPEPTTSASPSASTS